MLATTAAERATDAAGLVTVAIGAALTLAPTPTTAMLGLADRRGQARAIGLADVALGPGFSQHGRGGHGWPPGQA